jgi:hypothetical protein
VGVNAVALQIALLVTATVLSLQANSQPRSSVAQMRNFSATDDSFQFSYPASFQLCTKGRMGPCNQSYIPVCGEDALVCVLYPSTEFVGTSFGAASFEVDEVFTQREAMTADVCVTPSPSKSPGTENWPEFLISAKHPTEVIGGVLFVRGVSGGAATSHSISIDIYRAFHSQRCFSLSLSETRTDPGVTDPPMKTLSPTQRKKLDEMMSQILHSFRFAK